MTRSPPFSGFDGLMTLSHREGVDIRPTLLRVLTDLYVQASVHSADEERQFIELTSRLIDEVDDTTRAAVRARLAIYPATPIEILRKLGLRPSQPDQPLPQARAIPASMLAPRPPARTPDEPMPSEHGLSMQPKDAAEICDMFFQAGSSERAAMLQSLASTPLRPSARIPEARAARAVEILDMAAFISDLESFTLELGDSLILPARIAEQVVSDPSGEALACAAKALDMPAEVFQRVLLFLKPDIGQSVHSVFRLARLYDRLSERAALIMLAAWRGSVVAQARAKYRPALYDDERQRARASPRPASQPASPTTVRTGTTDRSNR
jgi:Uncharacterised protein conserved in bacteria (DUF2336)